MSDYIEASYVHGVTYTCLDVASGILSWLKEHTADFCAASANFAPQTET